MPFRPVPFLSRFSMALALAGLGCSGNAENGKPPNHEPQPLPFDQSPIVIVSQQSPGTYLLRLAQGQPGRINENYDVAQMKLSPSRQRLAQLLSYGAGVEIYELAGGTLVRTLENPGLLIGWAGEGAVLFATESTGGLARFDIASGTLQRFEPPDWVFQDQNGLLGYAVSPDGRGVAFVAWTGNNPTNERVPQPARDGVALFVTDTETGEVVNRWPIPTDLIPGQVHWAKDGHILYYTYGRSTALIGKRGAQALAEITLPIRVCGDGVHDWVTPDTLESAELIDIEPPPGCWECGPTTCANSWLISTDGTRAEQRSSDERPVAISPDGRKLLFWVRDGELAVSDPDGAQRTELVGIPKVGSVLW